MPRMNLPLAPVLFTSMLLAASLLPAAPAAFAAESENPQTLAGSIADATGAIIPGAQVELLDSAGSAVATATSDASGSFSLRPPHPGDYTLSVSMTGFETATQPVHAGGTAQPLQIRLAVAASITRVNVTAANDTDPANTESNGDTSVMTASDLKSLPVFDNDYVTAMSGFLDSGDTATAGSGLMVDGVEANRATVSPSAVQEIHINEDPYSAQYYRPGRGQLEIITRPAAESYHGEFNFLFRDSALNAQNAFAPEKPFEQRRIYEGHFTGPVPHLARTGFLFSFNRAEEDLQAVVNATGVNPTPENPSGSYNANVPAPTRDTEFSLRLGRQFTDRNNAYLTYAFQDSSNQNQGVGNQTLPEAGTDTRYREDDLIFHDDYILSATALNQASIVVERDDNHVADAAEGPHISVQGDFIGGSAQSDQNSSEINLRVSDMVTWTRGPHTFKFGVNVPHFSRRVLDDRTNAAGSYTFSPTYADDGVTVIATAAQNYQQGIPSGFSIAQGQSRFVYHQQESGAFFQDQIKLSPRFSFTPGLRYDWQNFLSSDRNNFSPRLSFAYVLDQHSKTVLRGGGGIYYDRIGGGPLVDLARYRNTAASGSAPAPRRRVLQVSSQQRPICYSGTSTPCEDLDALPPTLVAVAPGIHTPYQVHYGLSVERQIGEKATVSVGGRVNRGVDLFRSVDINAPLPQSGYTERPDPTISQYRQIQSEGSQKGAALDINYRGRFNRYFTAFAWYTWSHYANDTSGIYWFPEEQQNPSADWGPTDWDTRHRFGIYGQINAEHPLNLGFGVFANSGHPYTVTTGADSFGDNLFNARPDGVARNSEIGPDYADLDLRWGYDFKLRPHEPDKSPTLGLSASAFNVINHVNGSFVDSVESSPDFAQVTSAAPPRRMQVAMRFIF